MKQTINKIYIKNFDEIEKVLQAYRVIQKIVNRQDIKVECKLHEPYIGIGSISIITDNLEIINTHLFKMAYNLASNVDMYPVNDGKFQLDFTFNNLVKRIF